MNDLVDEPWLSDLGDLIAAGWPNALLKALVDPFQYAAQLRQGPLLYFDEAHRCFSPHWVKLTISDAAFINTYHPNPNKLTFSSMNTDRGLEVRVADILWIVDAPYGT